MHGGRIRVAYSTCTVYKYAYSHAFLCFVLQTETRNVYKTLLDGDEFTGFDLSPE